MVREFKKTGVAAALTGALLATASISSQAAVQLSTPGDVVLVPYVLCDLEGSINTLVGLTSFSKNRLGLVDAKGYQPSPPLLAGVTPGSTPTLPSTSPSGQSGLHWYFFDSRSVKQLDGYIPITDNDFIRFDWCTTIKENVYTKLDKVKGYLVFVDDAFDRKGADVPTYAFYGHSYMISGNWASQAFIPVVSNPVYSQNADNTVTWNVVRENGVPKIIRLVAGTDYTSKPGGTHRDLYMRYFLDPALASANNMVFWFNNNQDDLRANVPGETYDSEQNYVASFSYPLKDELNVITHTPSAPAFPGMIHQETETYGSKFTVVNTGIIRLGIPEYKSEIGYYSSGVAFNLLSLGGSDNGYQIQTEMATESASY